MEQRTLEINVMYAKDLNKVNLISKMDVYVVVFISDGRSKPNQKKKTPVSHDTDTNPSWSCPMKFTIDDSAARQNRLTLVLQLRCERALGDRDVGEVRVPIKELLDSPSNNDGLQQYVNYQVRKPNGKHKGQLSLSYKFGEKAAGPAVAKVDEPVKAYPSGPSQAYPPQSSYPPPSVPAGSYPPPFAPAESYPTPYAAAGSYPQPKYETPYAAAPGYPQGGPGHTPYGYPQQQAYGGYPPQGYPPPPTAGGYGGYPPPPTAGGYGGYPPAPGYGYPQQVMQPGAQAPKKNKFGMGLGAGLLGGALGGLLIGDMVSDASYDGGYDDGGGFDF